MERKVREMFSVSPQVYGILSQVSRYLFAFLPLLLVLRALLYLATDRRNHTARLKTLPGAGTIGELVVVSGSEELPPQTWLPVPREGVLGAVRTCDLVIPCTGVRNAHLDFSWQDGAGLLIRPRSGCEALVNGQLLDCRSDPRAVPLTNGGFLQVGSAQLRLNVFAALNPEPLAPAVAPAYQAAPAPAVLPADPAVPEPQAWPVAPADPAPPTVPVSPVVPSPLPEGAEPPREEAGSERRPRKRRADRWKEDWSE